MGGDQGQDVGRKGRGVEEDAGDAGTDAGTNQATEFHELIKPLLRKTNEVQKEDKVFIYWYIETSLLSCLPVQCHPAILLFCPYTPNIAASGNRTNHIYCTNIPKDL